MFFPSNMNSRQKKILGSWPSLLWDFAKREWISLFASGGLGVLLSQLVYLLWQDLSFQSAFASKYGPAWVRSDEPRHYVPYLIVGLVLFLASLVLSGSGNLWRGLKSWFLGVTSGLVFLPFASGLVISMLPAPSGKRRLILGAGLIVAWFLASFRLYLRSNVRAVRTINEQDFTVPTHVRLSAGSELDWSDDPIQTWTQDALGRAALVDSISVKVMVSKAPVVALTGPFGVGKTSVLNLLREHLGTKTITVSFSTWLPGSQETLTSYLLADIANECKKQFIVPGLRQSAVRLATALGQEVPLLSDYLKLIPSATQKDQIDNMASALLRLPKRVVVLLDEIDRMEKEEILTLLKVIRGVASLPNLSFVCAMDRDALAKTTGKDLDYFDKFFPVMISVPQPNPVALRKAGTDRLVSVFARRDWFDSDEDRQKFEQRIENLWDELIAPFCRNLRAIGLLANDAGVAAAPLHREVDPVDLTLIEMLRRVAPQAHRLIATNSFALTGGESLLRGGTFHDDKDEDEARKKFIVELRQMLPNAVESVPVEAVLNELFPLISKDERRLRRAVRSKAPLVEETDRRIRQPGIFPAYFRYELPDEIFSSVELATLLQQFDRAEDQSNRDSIFLRTLQSMDKGSLKRDDFLRKLADTGSSLSSSTGQSLGESVVKASDHYTYDTFAQFGEAGHALRLIHAVTKKLPKAGRVEFLARCILVATDETMALRVLTILTKQKDDESLDVSVADLYPSFIARMRRRYGRDVDATNMDLSTSDPWAFNLWGSPTVDGITSDPQDRDIQYDFWRRYIGNSRSRLAQAFRGFFLPVAAYSSDPEPTVENKIPVADLKKFYHELPSDPTMTDRDQKSLATLERFLNGEFKSGISPMGHMYDD
jgi:hypothetical protein